MFTILITGGAGFIGSNFVHYLLAKNISEHILILDALTYAGDRKRLAGTEKANVTFVHGDITNTSLLDSLFKQYPIKKIVHFAAESHVDRSIQGPAPFIHTNIQGTFHLLETAQKYWHNSDHLFLHVSTDEVYGDIPKDAPASKEDDPYLPNSPYSASKAASDHLVRAWQHTYGLSTIITHCSNNYGPWQYPEKLIPLFILNALEKKPLPVYGDGLQIRDWLHVEDHCAALWLLLEYGKPGETYNIGGNNTQTNLATVNMLCEFIDEITQPAISTKQLITHVTDRLGHDRRYALDCQKLMREFSWSPQHDFSRALRHVVTWYIDHLDWTRHHVNR